MTDKKLRSLDLMALWTSVTMSLVPLLPYTLEALAG
jgi:hypothetical protein